MKRTNIATLLIGTLLMFSPNTADAQFNKIMKSVGKVIGVDKETNSKVKDRVIHKVRIKMVSKDSRTNSNKVHKEMLHSLMNIL